MPATKNAHDWYCEEHDTYGWRGEECRQCPKAPSETDALRNELNRLVDLCCQDVFVSLAPFGAKVWCEMHSYFGPTFYRSEAAIKPIITPSRKTWRAFEAWQNSVRSND